jgi:hypothetical protein
MMAPRSETDQHTGGRAHREGKKGARRKKKEKKREPSTRLDRCIYSRVVCVHLCR